MRLERNASYHSCFEGSYAVCEATAFLSSQRGKIKKREAREDGRTKLMISRMSNNNYELSALLPKATSCEIPPV